jgi:hypothetical protein
MTTQDQNLNLNGLKTNKETLSDEMGLTKEQILLQNIHNIAEEYKEVELLKKKFVSAVNHNLDKLDFSKFIKFPNFDIKENLIKKKVAQSNISGLYVVSVDGSSVIKRFMNVDFSFLKAIAVKYYFYKNHSSKIEYYPDLSGFNNYIVQGNYFNREEHAVDAKISIDMTFMEINLLNKLIEKKPNIDLIIIDGSIVIMPINLLFTQDIEIAKKYDRLLREYQKLYRSCKENGIILIGSIKDTRTSALTNILGNSILMSKPNYTHLSEFVEINYRQVIQYLSDMDLFHRILQKAERSCIFTCKKDIDKIRDTGIKKEIPYYFPLNFYAFYLKTTHYDTPCRIEFFKDEQQSFKDAIERADLISSILLPISSLNEYYGLPIPQIEAHKRAVFKPSEIDLLFNNLSRKINGYGINLLEKRRARRPF